MLVGAVAQFAIGHHSALEMPHDNCPIARTASIVPVAFSCNSANPRLDA